MPLTHAELGQAMVNGGAGIWTAEQWATYWSLGADEQQAMASIMQNSPAAPGVNGWATALSVAEEVAKVAGLVLGLGSGIATIQSIIKAL
jgi:hypothetical protein